MNTFHGESGCLIFNMVHNIERRKAMQLLAGGLAGTMLAGILSGCNSFDSAQQKEAEREAAYHQQIAELFAQEALRNQLGTSLEDPRFAFDFVQQQYTGGWLLLIPVLNTLYFLMEDRMGTNRGDGSFEFPLPSHEGRPTGCGEKLVGEAFAFFYCSQNQSQKERIGRPTTNAQVYAGSRSACQQFENGTMLVLPAKHAVNSSFFVITEEGWRRLQVPNLK